MGTKALRYAFYGVLADVALVLGALLLLALLAAIEYDGTCGFSLIFFGSRSPCSRGEYVSWVVSFVGLVVVVEFWWALLPALLLPPVAGFWLGWRRPAR